MARVKKKRDKKVSVKGNSDEGRNEYKGKRGGDFRKNDKGNRKSSRSRGIIGEGGERRRRVVSTASKHVGSTDLTQPR